MSQETKTVSVEIPLEIYEAIKNLKMSFDQYEDPCISTAYNSPRDLILLETKGYIFPSEEFPQEVYYFTHFTWLIHEFICLQGAQFNPLDHKQTK